MRGKKKVDYRLYLLTDSGLCAGRELDSVIEQAVAGGVQIVQLREKNLSGRDFFNQALRIRDLTRKLGVPMIINDRLDIAMAVQADGVHLGQSDIPFKEARTILGNDAIIGLSVETRDQVLEADTFDVDYLGVGSIFDTSTKRDITIFGIEGLVYARKNTRHPIVAIGGINQSNVEAVIKAGADGIAVISAICSTADPAQSAKRLLTLVDKALEGQQTSEEAFA
jgi:thiamine-phosphate pyrophosphorylase